MPPNCLIQLRGSSRLFVLDTLAGGAKSMSSGVSCQTRQLNGREYSVRYTGVNRIGQLFLLGSIHI
jgi:hypothetical protein